MSNWLVDVALVGVQDYRKVLEHSSLYLPDKITTPIPINLPFPQQKYA